MDVTKPTLFWNSCEKSIGMGIPNMYGQVAYIYWHIFENHGCVDTNRVLCVSFKATYSKG